MTDYFIADPHIGHKSVIKFTFNSRLRKFFKKLLKPLGIEVKDIFLRNFDTLEEHNDFIVKRINSVVKKNDRLFILGDVIFGKDNFKYLDKMNGIKYLVAGNHDNYATKEYLLHFNKVLGVKAYSKRVALSHVPIHPQQLRNRFNINIHGHLHKHKLYDPRYINVSCEQINFTPISIHEIEERINKIKTIHVYIGMFRDFIGI